MARLRGMARLGGGLGFCSRREPARVVGLRDMDAAADPLEATGLPPPPASATGAAIAKVADGDG